MGRSLPEKSSLGMGSRGTMRALVGPPASNSQTLLITRPLQEALNAISRRHHRKSGLVSGSRCWRAAGDARFLVIRSRAANCPSPSLAQTNDRDLFFQLTTNTRREHQARQRRRRRRKTLARSLVQSRERQLRRELEFVNLG